MKHANITLLALCLLLVPVSLLLVQVFFSKKPNVTSLTKQPLSPQLEEGAKVTEAPSPPPTEAPKSFPTETPAQSAAGVEISLPQRVEGPQPLPPSTTDSQLPMEYLKPIRPTDHDRALLKLHATKRQEFLTQHNQNHDEATFAFLRWMASSSSTDEDQNGLLHEIPAWKPGKAKPIVCKGRGEFYSGYFSIPKQNILLQPKYPKEQDWGTVVPGRKETYVFKKEADYRADLEKSRFAITRRRFGWATNRNLEIMAAASIPYFCGIHRVPKTGTLQHLPLQFLRDILSLPGVRAFCDPHKRAFGIPIQKQHKVAGAVTVAPSKSNNSETTTRHHTHSWWNETLYEILNWKLLRYTQKYMTAEHHALYILSATSLQALPKRVLVLWASHYTIMLTGFINGLRELGVTVEDVPRRPEIYSGDGCEDAKSKTYAKGWFFFCKTKESPGLSRDNIEARIREKTHFDLIVISITDTLTYHMKDPYTEVPHYKAILESYPRSRILTLNDADLIKPMQADVAHRMMANDTIYFKRETHGCDEPIW